jgi:hypothetical protein
MSNQPEQTTMDTTSADSVSDAPVDDGPIVVEPEPEEEIETPPPPDPPASSITFEPFTWYEVTSYCNTTNTGNGEPCPNLNTSTTEPMVYSNAGTVRMICGLCNKDRPILAATKLNPQPEMT